MRLGIWVLPAKLPVANSFGGFMEEIEDRKKDLVFEQTDRDFHVSAWHLKNTEESKGDAFVELKYKDKIIRQFLFPSYKIWNIAAHFSDIVDGEISKDDKERGYRMAAWNGIGPI